MRSINSTADGPLSSLSWLTSHTHCDSGGGTIWAICYSRLSAQLHRLLAFSLFYLERSKAISLFTQLRTETVMLNSLIIFLFRERAEPGRRGKAQDEALFRTGGMVSRFAWFGPWLPCDQVVVLPAQFAC